MKKIIYYSDECNDDFFEINKKYLKNVNIDEKYVYLSKSIVFKIFSFVFIYIVAVPLLLIANVFFFKTTAKNRKKIKQLKKKGFFVYANHTNYTDAWLTPISVARFRKTYVIAEKTAVRIPFIRYLTKAGGVLPVADTPNALRNLLQAIEVIIKKKKIVTIFPEAHIWPFYTGVRPFPITSFRFPAITGAPAVPVAVCYKKRWFLGNLRKPRQIVFIGEPIYPQSELSVRENATNLRNECFNFIKTTVKRESNYSYIEYKKIQKEGVEKS